MTIRVSIPFFTVVFVVAVLHNGPVLSVVVVVLARTLPFFVVRTPKSRCLSSSAVTTKETKTMQHAHHLYSSFTVSTTHGWSHCCPASSLHTQPLLYYCENSRCVSSHRPWWWSLWPRCFWILDTVVVGCLRHRRGRRCDLTFFGSTRFSKQRRLRCDIL
jgi:hypothetical protein